jgi:hypothetical protein
MLECDCSVGFVPASALCPTSIESVLLTMVDYVVLVASTSTSCTYYVGIPTCTLYSRVEVPRYSLHYMLSGPQEISVDGRRLDSLDSLAREIYFYLSS